MVSCRYIFTEEAPCLGSGGIAQLVERLNGIQEVRGSTPLTSTRSGNKTTIFSND